MPLKVQDSFTIQDPNGLRYTRDGSFQRSSAGLLVTQGGEAVLSSTSRLLSLPPGEVSIGRDGVVSVAGGTAGTIGVVRFPPDISLTAEGSNRYVAPEGARSEPSRGFSVRQGALEGSNQDAVQATMALILAQRQAQMLQKALTIFHTDLNKFAAEDLPRV